MAKEEIADFGPRGFDSLIMPRSVLRIPMPSRAAVSVDTVPGKTSLKAGKKYASFMPQKGSRFLTPRGVLARVESAIAEGMPRAGKRSVRFLPEKGAITLGCNLALPKCVFEASIQPIGGIQPILARNRYSVAMDRNRNRISGKYMSK